MLSKSKNKTNCLVASTVCNITNKFTSWTIVMNVWALVFKVLQFEPFLEHVLHFAGIILHATGKESKKWCVTLLSKRDWNAELLYYLSWSEF